MKLAAVFLIALCVLGSAPAWAQDDVDADVDIDVDVEDMDEEVGAAHCILYKEIIADNDRVVAERNFTVSYTVFSIGDAACFDVGVSEDVPSSDFEIVDGEPEKFWEEPVEAGSKVTFNVTLMPNKAGVWTPARATLEYRDAASGEVKTSLSTSTGPLQILTPQQYQRDTATFEVEWATFFAMAFLCPVVVPFIINRMSKQDFKKKN